MEIEELTATIKTHYEETLKPLVDEGRMLEAKVEVTNMRMYLEKHARLIEKYHSGPNYLGAFRGLENMLNDGQDPTSVLEQFEVYLGQFIMATETGNMF